MSVAEIKAWLDKNGKSAVDIAAATKIHPVTVSRYLNGGRCFRSTVAAIENYIKSQIPKTEGKAATG